MNLVYQSAFGSQCDANAWTPPASSDSATSDKMSQLPEKTLQTHIQLMVAAAAQCQSADVMRSEVGVIGQRFS